LNVDRVTPGCDCCSCRIALRQMLVGCLCLGDVACLTGFLVCIASVFVFTAANPPGTSRTQPSASHFHVNDIPSSDRCNYPYLLWSRDGHQAWDWTTEKSWFDSWNDEVYSSPLLQIIQTHSGIHLAPCSGGTRGSLPWDNPLESRLRMRGAVLASPPPCRPGVQRATFIFMYVVSAKGMLCYYFKRLTVFSIGISAPHHRSTTRTGKNKVAPVLICTPHS